jgi:hypothetical protein
MNNYLGPQGKALSGLKASNWKNARESKAPLFTDVVFLTAGMLDGSLSKRGSRPCSQPDW